VSEDVRTTETEIHHRLLFEQAGMAMVAADPQGKITAWNHAARRMFGAGRGEMLGTDWAQLIPLEGRKHAQELLDSCVTENESAEFEFSLRDEHGASRRLAAIITPVSDHDGRRIGGLACIRDITNRAVLRDRLAQQSKMAALGEMAGALSHHFNNILGGVVTSVDFALASRDPAVILRVLENTATALPRATRLVENLLAFAEGDYRDATLCELGEVIIQLIEQTEPKLKGTDVVLQVDVEEIPVIEVPRSALLTVLTNLMDNAIEAMPNGGTLSLCVRTRGDQAVVRVSDSGCGLDEESLTRIFEPFYSTKSRGDESKLSRGLGLAVAHGIVKVLSGSVHVTSVVGEGTTFEVRLPLPGESRRP
jgi:PAS domain S-box-containing protein